MLFDLEYVRSNDNPSFSSKIGEFCLILKSAEDQQNAKYIQERVNIVIDLTKYTEECRANVDAIYISEEVTFGAPGDIAYTIIQPIKTADSKTSLYLFEDENLKLPKFPTPPNEE